MPSTAPCNLLDLPLEIRSLMAGKIVYCSFSGGADSLALLLFLKEWSRRISFSMEAVHFEHGFRGTDSLADAAFCRDVCQKEQIPFQLFRIDVPAHRLKGEGDEEAARRLRLDYWRKIVRNPGNSLIAIGHHADDRVENVLLRLFRGSNASGLSSMRAVQKMGNLTLIRPFIDASRTDIEAWLAVHCRQLWRHDASNDSIRYRRNYIRLKLLPEIMRHFPSASSGIRQSLRTLESDAVCLEQLAQKEFERLGFRLMLTELAGIPPALRARLLRLFLQREFQQPSIVPDSKLLDRFERLIAVPRPSAKIPIRGFPEWRLVLCHGIFQLQPVVSPTNPEISWNPFDQPYCEWNEDLIFRAEVLKPEQVLFSRDKSSAFFDADQIRGLMPLQLSCWRAGDKLVPFGKKNPVRLKKLFADAEIATAERSAYPVVRGADGSILWAAKLRNSNIAPVTEQTGLVLRLSAVQNHLRHQC